MGCPADICVYAPDGKAARSAFVLAETECHRLDKKYSHYRADSDLSQLLQTATRTQGTRVDRETAALLNMAATQYEESQGRFDITAGLLTALWERRTTLPGLGEIASAQSLTGWNRVEWDGSRLRLSRGMRLDLGGIVKEYAADRAAIVLKSEGFESGYVDLGGDLHVLGPHPDSQPWKIGVRNPRGPGGLASIELRRGGLATSGDYERYTIIGGRRYSHLVNPLTGWPVAGLASVSVAAPGCLLAGAVSTMAMLMGAEEGVEFLRSSSLAWLAHNGEHFFSGGGGLLNSETPSTAVLNGSPRGNLCHNRLCVEKTIPTEVAGPVTGPAAGPVTAGGIRTG